MRKCRTNISNTAFKSWDFILFKFVKYDILRTHPQKILQLPLSWKIGVFEDLNFLMLQAHYSLDNFLIECRHLPHETLTQDVCSHEMWERLKAKNEIGQISFKIGNMAILLC